MERKIKSLYQEYLYKKLDLVFSSDKKRECSLKRIPKNNIKDKKYLEYKFIRKDNKYNYQDSNGKLISEEWFDDVESNGFKYGYARVENDGKYNYINTNGKLISEEWFDDVEFDAFVSGYAQVRSNGKYNYINTNGKLISEEWFDYVESDGFTYGCAWVKKYGKYNYINTEGKRVINEWFDDIEYNGFAHGYAKVYINGHYNYINTEGRLLNEDGFDDVEKEGFTYGYAWVYKNGKYNYINTNGKLISKEWFDKLEIEDLAKVYDKISGENIFVSLKNFQYGYAWVCNNFKYNYINTNGELISDEWFDTVERKGFMYGYAMVVMDDKYNYIDTEGNIISNEWFDEIEENAFAYGYALVKRNDKYNYINKKGKLISRKWYDYATPLINGVAKIKIKNRDSFIIVYNNNLILGYERNLYIKNFIERENSSFINIDNNVIPIEFLYNVYSLRRNLIGYEVSDGTIKFNIKYEPIKLYGERYILCLHKNNVYLYNLFNDTYKLVGQASKITYDDNFIFDNENDKVYFINENEILDITGYYKVNLEGKSAINILRGIKIESYDSFTYTNSEEIDKEIKEDRDRIRKDEEERIKNEQRLEEQQEQEENICQAKSIISNLKISFRKLGEVQSTQEMNVIKNSQTNRIKIEPEELLIKENDYYIIDPKKLDNLRYYELSKIVFHKVKLEGVDFSKTNIEIDNLLDCYNRSLRNCNFEGVSISPFTDFTGVDIRGCHFSRSSNYHGIESLPNFSNAIYDETTTYNGEPISKILNIKKKIMI